jgi:hypothetical protein
MKIKYFIGPMSKNVVDACVEYISTTENNIGFIPSRRQVEYNGGYVNNWTTKQFKDYICNTSAYLVRDHAGPGQGLYDDDGFKSLEKDCEFMDMIHIDPWKKYPDYESGLLWTLDMIRFCYERNPTITYEVGTEQSIRKFEANELDRFLQDLRSTLKDNQYQQIRYCVVQSGTSLKENINTGLYDSQRLEQMIQITKKHNLLSKEHNGDYLPPHLIKEKMSIGLDSINIAPEFGQIEIKTYLEQIEKNEPDLIECLWEICYNSNRWKKWVDNTFNPIKQKKELINICGHYVLSSDEFLAKIRPAFRGIDEEIKNNVKLKLEKLYFG